MQLVCEKFGEKMESSVAICGHPNDYCKFRQNCMIHFVSRENARKPEETVEPQESGSGK